MKKSLTLLLVSFVFVNLNAQSFCEEVSYYFQQLTVNCRNMAGRVIPAVKEHVTTRIITGMHHGQCSGIQPYTNEFVKFYSKNFGGPELADSLFQQFKTQLAACLKADGFTIESQANMDDGDKMIRWGKNILKTTKTLILDLKPGPDGGFVVTLEMILS